MKILKCIDKEFAVYSFQGNLIKNLFQIENKITVFSGNLKN